MLIGRGEERARIDALLEAARRGRTGVLVVAGDPGIGKTALLDAACERAAGMRLLRSTAVEAEAELPYAGLHALLLPLLDLLPGLEEPQERALRVALALAAGNPPETLAVNAGTLSLLAAAARERPLLVVLDDLQWLDRPTAAAVAFAARRLAGEQIAFLLGRRTGTTDPLGRGFEQLELEPLGADDARALLAERRDPVPPGAVGRLLELAAGNPLALLELPPGLASGDDAAPVGEQLRLAFAARVASLPAPSRQAIVLAAAEADAAAVERACERLGLGRDALAPAEAAGLLRVGPDGLVFRHPLVRSLAHTAVEPEVLRALHRALADALTGEDERDRRAWHLAAAATGPDEDLATLLEETADRAAARGGHDAAARALEQAARLSLDQDVAARRLVAAARAAFWAGDAGRGDGLVEEALTLTGDPLLRTDALLELNSIRATMGTPLAKEGLLADVAAVEQLDPDQATRLLLTLLNLHLEALDTGGALELAPQLERAARRAGAWWRPRGLATAAAARLAAGETDRFSVLAAEVWEDPAVAAAFAEDLIAAEAYGRARDALSTTLREGRAAGNRMRVIWNQTCLARLDLRLGRLARAVDEAAEAITIGEAHGATLWVAHAQATLAGIRAWRGDEDSSRPAAEAAISAALHARSAQVELSARAALGLLALGLGRPEGAVDELAAAARLWDGSTVVEPSLVAFVPDLVEALVRCGERAEALRRLERFRAAAGRTDRRWALAAVARCDGLLAGPESFAEPFERSLELLDGTPLSLDRARTDLAYGERLRRAARRREARSHLHAAREAFALAGATPWVERSAAELRATGVEVGRTEVDPKTRLTPQELEISRLVAEGRTNKEIAVQLYLSPKTIEYHLTNVYRKLDVHSRAGLVGIIVTRGDPRSG